MVSTSIPFIRKYSPLDNDLYIVEMDLPSDSCSYLPNERQNLTYRVIPTLPSSKYCELLRRGWRRQGIYFFRPTCPNCTKCRSLRVPLEQFRASKSQRRAVRRNHDIDVRLTVPILDDEHIDLFNRYHQSMHEHRGWPFNEITSDSYSESFLGGHWTFDRQMSFRRNGKLVGVSLIDVLDDVSSSIYFYHDPDWRPMAPGTFSMMCELKYLQNQGLKHHYLGYWIKECQSMEYKSRFSPHELLESYVDDATEPNWTLA